MSAYNKDGPGGPHFVWATAQRTIGGGHESGSSLGRYPDLKQAVRAIALHSLWYAHRWAWPPLDYEITGHPTRDPELVLQESQRQCWEEEEGEN